MGIEIEHDSFEEKDYARFKLRLQEQLAALDAVLRRANVAQTETCVGAELEFFLVDDDARPLPVSRDVVRDAANPMVTPEMGAFDIELSTPPVRLAGAPFTELGEHLARSVAELRRRAAAHGARIVPVSVLPTFKRSDFHPSVITDLPRYRALAAGMRKLRQAPFFICIDGEDPLELTTDDVAMEAANTAFQLHLDVRPDAFARFFNAAMMLTGPVLAAAANSPTFLGHRLWHETRVALFAQAGDDRPQNGHGTPGLPPRIGFGNGWVRDGALELFMESVALHPPLLPVCRGKEDALAVAHAGRAPDLDELRLHHGTVWKWNRPVYDPAKGGHLRIELRALPSGPTIDDMLANAAFLVGGILALADEVCDLLPSFPFSMAKRNFFEAARHGLDATLVWPTAPGRPPEKSSAGVLLRTLVPRAERGLVSAGVAPSQARRYLEIFEERVRSGQTGAVWQREALAELERHGRARAEALKEMLEAYMRNSDSGAPVHTWPSVS